MGYWILQANPARYRLVEALSDASSFRTWTVARYRRAIVPGDRFALWVTGARGGVYALGSVTAGADFIPGDDHYWANPAEAERPAWRVGISIEEVLPIPILRAELAEDPAFAGASIIRMPGGGNPFPVSERQWQAIQSRRPRAVAGPLLTSVTYGDSGRAAGRQPSHQALAWTREEDILALDLFVRAGVVNGGRFLSESDPRVVALSEELRALPTHPGVARDERFRNPSGVALKLMNFRAVERMVKRDLGIEGADALPAGMPRFSALDKSIFAEYFSREFQGLAEDAQAVRAGSTDVVGSPAARTATDRPVEDAGTPTYETAGAEGGTRTRSEHDLVRRYADWLSASGLKVASRLYRVPGLARPFLCDVFLPEKNALIEAKSTDRREAIRMAIGQLLDYQYLEGTQRRLAVLLPYPPAAEARNLLDSLGIGAIWPFGEGFRDSAHGTFTKG